MKISLALVTPVRPGLVRVESRTDSVEIAGPAQLIARLTRELKRLSGPKARPVAPAPKRRIDRAAAVDGRPTLPVAYFREMVLPPTGPEWTGLWQQLDTIMLFHPRAADVSLTVDDLTKFCQLPWATRSFEDSARASAGKAISLFQPSVRKGRFLSHLDYNPTVKLPET